MPPDPDPGLMPESWSEIVIVPIFKKGNPNLPSNYRPISLLNTVTKLFTTILTTRLDTWCSKQEIISEFQAGFKRGTGCVEQVFVLNTLIQNQLRHKNSKLFCLMVDLSSAFDLVTHGLMWTKLHKKGLSDKFINVIKKLYSHACAKVRIGTDFTESYKVTRSVLQGESLSPKLFSLFIDDIVDFVNDGKYSGIRIGKHDVHMLLFADDIALVAVTAEELQYKINRIKLYFEANNMKVNLLKTKVIIFRRKRAIRNIKFLWGNQEIEIVDSFTYLGIPLHYSGNFEYTAKHFIKKSENALENLILLFTKGKIGNIIAQEKLFMSLCQSVLFYGVVIWGAGHMDKIMVFQNKFLRKLFYLYNETPRYFLMLETGVKPIENCFLNVLLKFLYRISQKQKNSLVRNCLIKQYEMSETGSKKFNWCHSVNVIFKKWEIPLIDSSLKHFSRPEHINKIVKKHHSLCINDYVMSMVNSKSLYSTEKKKLSRNFLHSDISFTNKRLYIQFRSNKNYIFYKKKCELKGTRVNNYGRCDLCNKSEIEDVYHIFCSCPHYNNIRTELSQSFNCNFKTLDKKEFYKLLMQIENKTNDVNTLCNAWKKCMNTRDFISNF